MQVSCDWMSSYILCGLSTCQSVDYVNEWTHLGHIISANCDDKSDILSILSRRNTLCGQINNVLCYFGKCKSVVRQKLMFAYCYSLYGSVLWDLNSSHIELLPRDAL